MTNLSHLSQRTIYIHAQNSHTLTRIATFCNCCIPNMCAMTLRFANVDYKKFRVEMLQLAGFKARVQKVVDTVMKTGFFKNAETVAYACEAMRAKFLMADK